MKIYFAQFFSEAGISFPFTHHFNHRLSKEITALVIPSPLFTKKYGDDWGLMFRIDAKSRIAGTEIKGPWVSRKDKDVEYFIALPFSVLRRDADVLQSAVGLVLDGVSSVLASLGISTRRLEARRSRLIKRICSDPAMFTPEDTRQEWTT